MKDGKNIFQREVVLLGNRRLLIQPKYIEEVKYETFVRFVL